MPVPHRASLLGFGSCPGAEDASRHSQRRGRQVLSTRIGLRRIAAVAVAMSVLTGVVAVPIAAATSTVSGSLTYREKVALTPAAVAIVTIIDTTAAADAGVIIGQQVINGPTALPIDFSVLVEADQIDQKHAYALY